MITSHENQKYASACTVCFSIIYSQTKKAKFIIIVCKQTHVGAQARGIAASVKLSGFRKLTFLAPLHQTPSRLIALLFAAHARDAAKICTTITW